MEVKTIPTWGYHPVHAAKIFDLAPGEKLPKGWHDNPVSAEEELLKADKKSEGKAEK
ncbi:hypothetical protein RA307_04815 [Xanthobacteraceae bacterium Astr-EGSB]|uniref:hypothetical protein n=1 Tax=Astrobacterium formosum TaxID=3069710 RepID=UPI0027B0C91C|nr:hypothetical protein [Xanthobacteraceae bacterium Astr-EGSB]